MPPQSSSAQQLLEALGARLREIRQDARFSGRDLGRLAGWHPSKVSRIEHARQTPSVDDIRAWCRHCAAGDRAEEMVASLRAAEGLFVEWRRKESTGLRLAQEAVLPLWERTRRFRIYNPRLIPGPVQSREYVRAILAGTRTMRSIVADDVDAAVQVRMDRQHVVHEGDHRFAIVLEESVLRYPIGGVDTMAAQLGHLLTASALPSVSLGIIPLGADRSGAWPAEGFWMFDEAQVSVELVSGHLTITQPHEIAMYAKVFGALSRLAVRGAEARALIASAINVLDRYS